MTEDKIIQLEKRLPTMGLAFAKATIQSVDSEPVHPSAIASIALDFMEGAFQALQEVRLEMDFETFDYHERYPIPKEIEDMQDHED